MRFTTGLSTDPEAEKNLEIGGLCDRASGMLKYSEINSRFLLLDQHPVLLDTVFAGWLAWPIVKERLWLVCMALSNERSKVSVSPLQAAKRIASGALQIANHLSNPVAADIAMGFQPREVTLPDGRVVHPQLGDLTALGRGMSILQFHYAWGRRTRAEWRAGVLDDVGVGATVAASALAVRQLSSVTSVARKIVEAVGPHFPEVSPEKMLLAASDQLARFRIRFGIFLRLFRASGIRAVVVTDWDGKVAEVAAGKAAGVDVIELQHGVFSTRDPDYSWTNRYRTIAHRLPIPDRVIVFGPAWARQLKDAGFWNDDQIMVARNPVLSSFRDFRSANTTGQREGPLTVLFPTQPYIHDTALELLGSILEMQALRSKDGVTNQRFRLRIKIHPRDQDFSFRYSELAKRFPETCAVVSSEQDAFSEMMRADIAVGYTSLMLLEAVALGIPVIALRGQGSEESFCSTFNLQELEHVVYDCESSTSLLKIIGDLADANEYDRVAKKVYASASRVYCFEGPGVEQIISRL